MESTTKLEFEIGRKHTPDVAWPTIVMFVILWVTWIGATWLAVNATIPLAAGATINTVVFYIIYTPLHDATHGAIARRQTGWTWINTAIGMACALPIWMFFHHHRMSHRLHHRQTNEPQDPDGYAIGSFPRIFFIGIPGTLLQYLNPITLYRECRPFKVKPTETRLCMTLFLLQTALVAGFVANGYWLEFLLLWFIPWFVGNLLMLTAFAWSPHHDHCETDRYRNTRISLFPLGDVLYLQQNLHLVHHMVSGIPWYRYRAAFEDMRPLLERHGARIEGFWPTSPGASSKPR